MTKKKKKLQRDMFDGEKCYHQKCMLRLLNAGIFELKTTLKRVVLEMKHSAQKKQRNHLMREHNKQPIFFFFLIIRMEAN